MEYNSPEFRKWHDKLKRESWQDWKSDKKHLKNAGPFA